jgi:aspartate aminotransferase-like enzyme
MMIPPGLAFVAVSKRAIEAMESSTLPKFYFDLRKALKAYMNNDTPWTPAISLIIGADAALQMIRAEGVENIWRRHERLATALHEGIRAIGLKLFSDSPSFAVTPVWLPADIQWKQFNRTLKEKYGITIAGGQEEYAGKIFRISHLGYYDELDMITILSALEMTLFDFGFQFELGSGIRATQASFLTTDSMS